MSPLTALVVDDEAPARSELAWLLEREPAVGSVLQAADGGTALDLLDREHVDVLFSDISMPGLDGIQLTRVIARLDRRPAVVLVTAHDQYAVDAFELEVTDYLLKPVRPERLSRAVQRVAGTAVVSPTDDERIPVEKHGITRFVLRSDVRYVQAQGDYAQLHTESGAHLVRVPLSTLEERWRAAGFVRIHRSTLINVRFVEELQTSDGRMGVTVAGTVLAVSRRHAPELRHHLLRNADG